MADASQKKTVLISQMAFGGAGVARFEGKVFFVQNALMGDMVEIEVTDDKDRFGQAKVIDVVSPGIDRIKAPCPVFGTCGGCQWQNATYDSQFKWKLDIVKQQLIRIAKMTGTVTLTGTQSPKVFNYRNRAFLRIHIDGNGAKKIGFFKQSTRDLIAISECYIADPAINIFIKELQRTELELKNLQLRFEVQVFSELEGKVSVVVHPNEKTDLQAEMFAKTLQTFSNVFFCEIKNSTRNEKFLFELTGNISYFTFPGIFQQVNLGINNILRDFLGVEVGSRLKIEKLRILDLFCGNGNLSLQFVRDGAEVSAVEFNKQSIDCAHSSLEVLQKNADYIAGDSVEFLKEAVKKKSYYDMIIADPPRDGMDECLLNILKLAPEYIFYISCDPATLSRDLLTLNEFYKVEKIHCFDFFPHTYHIETLVVMQKKAKS